jgi:hypothetical protein
MSALAKELFPDPESPKQPKISPDKISKVTSISLLVEFNTELTFDSLS